MREPDPDRTPGIGPRQPAHARPAGPRPREVRWSRARWRVAPGRARDRAGTTGGDLSVLDDHLFCLLLTRRRDGRLVPTPLSFAREGRRVVVRTDAASPKVGRARRHPDALVAPCGPRGRPRGEAIAMRARVLTDPSEREAAEAAITARYGLRGRLWSGLLWIAKLDAAYIELTGVRPLTPP